VHQLSACRILWWFLVSHYQADQKCPYCHHPTMHITGTHAGISIQITKQIEEAYSRTILH
jgi:hypothetical protein